MSNYFDNVLIAFKMYSVKDANVVTEIWERVSSKAGGHFINYRDNPTENEHNSFPAVAWIRLDKDEYWMEHDCIDDEVSDKEELSLINSAIDVSEFDDYYDFLDKYPEYFL